MLEGYFILMPFHIAATTFLASQLQHKTERWMWFSVFTFGLLPILPFLNIAEHEDRAGQSGCRDVNLQDVARFYSYSNLRIVSLGLTFVTWNVGSLLSKLGMRDYVIHAHIVLLPMQVFVTAVLALALHRSAGKWRRSRNSNAIILNKIGVEENIAGRFA